MEENSGLKLFISHFLPPPKSSQVVSVSAEKQANVIIPSVQTNTLSMWSTDKRRLSTNGKGWTDCPSSQCSSAWGFMAVQVIVTFL